MDRNILGSASSRKITGTVAAIDANVLMHLVTKQSFENAVHVIVGDKAKATAVGPEQQVNLRRKPETDPHAQERFKNRQLHGIEKFLPWLI